MLGNAILSRFDPRDPDVISPQGGKPPVTILQGGGKHAQRVTHVNRSGILLNKSQTQPLQNLSINIKIDCAQRAYSLLKMYP